MKHTTIQTADSTDSKKRSADDVGDQVDDTLPSPSNSPKSPSPKRQHLAVNGVKDKASHLSVTDKLTKVTLSPQNPSKKPTRKQQLASDSINISVYNLRKEGRGWDDIATRTNAACNISEKNELTSAACYSRFFRNGPLVAKAKGEEWKKAWYVHMKGAVVEPWETKNRKSVGRGKEPANEVKERLVLGAVKTVKAEFWARVTERVNEQLGESRKMTENRVKDVFDRVCEDGE